MSRRGGTSTEKPLPVNPTAFSILKYTLEPFLHFPLIMQNSFSEYFLAIMGLELLVNSSEMSKVLLPSFLSFHALALFLNHMDA